MAIMGCKRCGIAFDYDLVPLNPFKVCPSCHAPLDQGAVDHAFVEAANPSDVKDSVRVAGREALAAQLPTS